MDLQSVCLVMELISSNTSIEKCKFFRHDGHPCDFSPAAGVLFEDHITGAIAVIHNTPIFIGDRLWYTVDHFEGFVNVVAYDNRPGGRIYYFTAEGVPFHPGKLAVSNSMLDRFLFLDKPKQVYEKMSFNGTPVTKLSKTRTDAFPFKVIDSKGTEYWADSYETIQLLESKLQELSDTVLAGIAAQKTVRVFCAGKTSILITH